MRRYTHGAMLRTEAIKGYNSGVYDGVVTLFRSELSEIETEKVWLELGLDLTSPALGWDLLSAHPLVIQRVPGYHVNMVEEPYSQVLAAKLRSARDEADAAM